MISTMHRRIQRIASVVILAGIVNSAGAFSMLGQFDGWQIPRIGYDLGQIAVNADLGGPMNLGEEYRWNIRTITYGFDESFVNYFGQKGVDEIEKAFDILNSLRAASKISDKVLASYPTDTRRVNQQAAGLFIRDIKSLALGMVLEQIGLASSERYVWTLRDRFVQNNVVTYSVIQRNFDPFTRQPSKYVNGTLYTYSIFEITSPGGDWADAVEIPVDPLAHSFTSVSSLSGGLWSGISAGEYYTGLTRDDVAGLREIYRKNNFNVETLLPGTQQGSGVPWSPVGGANTNFVDQALRPGVDKVLFRRARYDSLFNFIVTTNSYTDSYVTNSHVFKQGVQRQLTAPDIIFTAEDLGTINGIPVVRSRTDTGGWINNDGINGQATLAGPGVATPQVVFTFTKVGPYFVNQDTDPFLLTEAGASVGLVWGSFDGTTNAPIVYPLGTSIEEIEALVLGGGN